jgi:hypothetical protein
MSMTAADDEVVPIPHVIALVKLVPPLDPPDKTLDPLAKR